MLTALTISFILLTAQVPADTIDHVSVTWFPSPSRNISMYRIYFYDVLNYSNATFTTSNKGGAILFRKMRTGTLYIVFVTAINHHNIESKPSNYIFFRTRK